MRFAAPVTVVDDVANAMQMGAPELTQPAELGAVIVGGGPSGLSLLLAARKGGVLETLLASGIRIIERTAQVGSGEIGRYSIRSDSLADSFLKTVDVESNPPLRGLLQQSAGKQVDALRGKPVHLSIVGEFLAEVGAEMRRRHPVAAADPFVTDLAAIRADQQRDGSWLTLCRGADGGTQGFHSRALVIATGAHQPAERLFQEKVAGVPLLPRFAHKTIQSAEFLGHGPHSALLQTVSRKQNPKVAIVGGSHSALASANVCMLGSHGMSFGAGAITVLHRGAIRLTYGSAAQALSDGYDTFDPEDLCHKTGRVFPLAGMRSDSREMLRRHWGLGGLKSDDRLRLLRLEESRYDEADRVLQEADLIVAALGYRPRALPLFDAAGRPLRLLAEIGACPLVDARSRVLSATGQVLPGAFAMGLAAGYPLAGAHGESNFAGQANGLALWQSDVGEEIVAQLLELSGAHAPCPA